MATSAPPPHTEHPLPQLGMVNPPRRVKRLREIALRDPEAVPAQRPPTPPEPAGTPRRRGRKPAGPLSKSAREQLRKTNHSVIEKRRREKINEALAALRELVPSEKQQQQQHEGGGEGKKEDKEFKLEVLVRTVEYLRIMVDKVRNLETAAAEGCSKCGAGPPETAQNEEVGARSMKRVKRMVPDSETEDMDNDAVHLHPLPSPPHKAQHQPPHPRLPSISSWIADASLMSSPHASPLPRPSPNSNVNASPRFPTTTTTNPHTFQLPSPPQTVPFAPTTIAATGFPPRLVLPAPIGPIDPASSTPCTSYAAGSASPVSPNALTSPATLTSPASPPSLALPREPERRRQQERRRKRDMPDLPLDVDSSHVDTSLPLPLPPPSQQQHLLREKGGGRSRTGGRTTIPDSTRAAHSARSASWSRDDQTAASLLLNISARRGGCGTEVVGAGGEGDGEGEGVEGEVALGFGLGLGLGLGGGDEEEESVRYGHGQGYRVKRRAGVMGSGSGSGSGYAGGDAGSYAINDAAGYTASVTHNVKDTTTTCNIKDTKTGSSSSSSSNLNSNYNYNSGSGFNSNPGSSSNSSTTGTSTNSSTSTSTTCRTRLGPGIEAQTPSSLLGMGGEEFGG